MKQKISLSIKIPEGITCEFKDNILICKKESLELQKEFHLPATTITIKDNEINFLCKKGNKIHYKTIKAAEAHIKNMFSGLSQPFEYKLEAVNVHFPMTLKIDGDKLAITNFLGEKIPRQAIILPNVEVSISGQEILVKSPNREAAGQTSANIEKATKLKGRDRRIFQDGVYITHKPGEKE
jgi:large subunit ribosomal protein L6